MKHSLQCNRFAISFRRACKKADCGAGTMLGIMLVLAICAMLTFSAVLGSVLVAKHRAHAVASVAALSGAATLQRAEGDACNVVASTVSANNAIMESCKIISDDVTVKVSVPLNLPFASNVSVIVRAGLEDCAKAR